MNPPPIASLRDQLLDNISYFGELMFLAKGRLLKKTLGTVGTLGLLTLSAQVHAISGSSPMERLQGRSLDLSQDITLRHTSFSDGVAGPQQRAFGLLGSGQISLENAVRSYLQSKFAHPGLKLKRTSSPHKSFLLSPSSDSENYGYTIGGIDVCDAQVRAHKLKHARDPVIMGSLPQITDDSYVTTGEWPSLQDSLDFALNEMSAKGFTNSSVEMSSVTRCYLAVNGVATPVWQFKAKHQGLFYKLKASADALYQFDPGFFSVDGQARAFKRNPFFNSGETEDVTLEDLVGDGYLTNAVFTTETDSNSGKTRIFRANNEFLVDPNITGSFEVTVSDFFPEVNVFVHANKTHDWFTALGFQYDEESRLTIRMHDDFDGEGINNALYSPDGPTIRIGDGNGVELANLPLDADVVSHEFGHHIVFQTVTQTTSGSESLVMHEALSDFFTFARTGDACLGEAICPDDSPFECFSKGQCLRSAENNYNFQDPDLPPQAHLRSQFVSGMLWDLRASLDVPANDLNKIVYKGVGMLVANAKYADLVVGMMLADRELFNGQYNCTIYDNAVARGLGAAISGFDCTTATADLPSIGTNQDAPAPAGSAASGSTGSAGRKNGQDNKSLCGFIVVNGEARHFPFGMLILLLPVVYSLVFRSRKAQVKS